MVTLKEVAEAAGVAVSTASRALHRQGRLSEKTETRIRAIAEELGYSVNHAGRALITGRTGLVGVVVPRLTNPFFAAVVEGVQLGLEAEGRSVVLVEGRSDSERELRVMRDLFRHVDAFVVVTPATGSEILADFMPEKPLVTVDRPVRGRSGVVIDTESGIASLVSHLGAGGAKQIAYVGGPPGSRRDVQRSRAFERAARDERIEQILLGPVEPSVEAGVRMVDRVLASGVDGVVAFSSHVALGLHFSLSEEAGVEVTAADDLSIANAGSPLLTALKLPLVRAGELASELLLEQGTAHKRCLPQLLLREE